MFTATISRNLRYLSAGQTTVLLRNVVANDTIVRDHMWVELTRELEIALKSNKWFGKNRSAIVNFEGDLKEYNYRGACHKQTLENVKNIRIVGRA